MQSQNVQNFKHFQLYKLLYIYVDAWWRSEINCGIPGYFLIFPFEAQASTKEDEMCVLKYYYLGYAYWVARYFTVVARYLVNIHMNDRFYRAMQLPSAVLGVVILCVRPSVRLSVIRVLCD